LLQTYRPVEVIFVDGGSTDGAVKEVLRFAKEYSDPSFTVRLLKESDYGSLRSYANARNLGALNVRGRYIAFFDADFDLASNIEALSKIADAFSDGAVHVAITYVPNMHTWIERNLVLDDIIYHFNEGKPQHMLCCFKASLFRMALLNPTRI